jgi:outer membrane protein assembly factor BamE (lipoprotein component of BamABCDE complex)
MGRLGLFSVVSVLLAALVACSPIQRFHGYAPDDALLAQIEVGRDTRETVAEKVGRPGMAGVMEGGAWYYVQSDWIERNYRAPEEIRREVVAISFDAADRVSNIERFGLENGNVITLSRRVTDTGQGTVNIVRSIFSNLGRFNPRQALGGRS